MATKKETFSVNYSELLKEVLTKEGTVSTCFRTFHKYSIHNQFLAFWQMHVRNIPISPINSFGGWQALNRKIKAKEKAIWLWMPIQYKKKEKNSQGIEEEVTRTCFKYLPRWFAMAQTESRNGSADLTANDFIMPNFDFNKVYDFYGIKLIPFAHIDGNVQGYANSKRELAINPLAEEPEMTILHEIAHIALRHSEVTYGTDLQELEAESIAYIIGSILGLSETNLSHSRGYIQGWFKGNEIPETNVKNILSKAQRILELGTGKKLIKGKA